MRRMKLTRYEKGIEDALIKGEYRRATTEEFDRLKAAIDQYKKNSILHIRINDMVLRKLKEKAKKLGVKYQTFIAEILKNVAHS